MRQPDKIDKQLMRLLQEDGRQSNADLADAVGVSAATCHRRTQALFDDGLITAVNARIAPEAVDLGALVMVSVVLDRSTPESFAAFEDAVSDMTELLDCHLVAGEFDFLLKLRVRDLEDFNAMHSKMLIALPGVRQVRTFFVLKEIKEHGALVF